MKYTLLFPLALVTLGAVACGGGAREPQTPATQVVAPSENAAPVAAQASRSVQAPQPLVASPPEQDLQAKTGGPSKDEDVALDPARAAAQVEAQANAEQQTKDRAKWDKMGRDIERKTTDTDARDRLAKATARVAQAQNQQSRVLAARRGKFNTDMVTFGSKKVDVQSRINSIYAYGSDEWKRMRAELDRALDEMDMAATRVEGDLF